MSVAAAHATQFFDDVAASGRVWTLRDAGGFPSPPGDGGRAMPFWSSLSRVELIISRVDAYKEFEPVELALSVFLERWIPGLERDGLKVGVNWSGARAMGYDFAPGEVTEAIRARLTATSNNRLEPQRHE